MVEQMGHASAGVTVSETALPVAARSCQAGAVKKYDVGTATNTDYCGDQDRAHHDRCPAE
jgi:hypothetical protein